MHSEGILAGELKHGPLALIDKQMPVIMVIMKDPCFAKCQNALQQVTARQVRALRPAGSFSPVLFRSPTSPTVGQHQQCVFVPAGERVSSTCFWGPGVRVVHIQKGTGQPTAMPTEAPR